MNTALTKYIEYAKRIRELFSPKIAEGENAEEYRRRLQRSFAEIRELALESEDILRREYYPLVSRTDSLTEEQIEDLNEFFLELLNATDMENMDLPILFLQAERRVTDADEKKDTRTRILAMDSMVMAAYAMMALTQRLWPCYDFCFRYRDQGLAAAKVLMEYLEPEKFAALPDDTCKEAVLINSRYICALFEWEDIDYDHDRIALDLEILRKALALAEVGFYREQAPDYDWNYHIFRTLQYITCFSEDNNRRRHTLPELKAVEEYTKRFVTFLRDVMPEMEEECDAGTQRLYLLRSTHFAGSITREEYKAGLEELIGSRDVYDYSPSAMFLNFNAPYEYILILDPENLSEKEEGILRDFYSGLAGYIYRSPKMSSLSFMITFLADIMRCYIELPGAPTFRELCLNLTAALHPPTYIHTLCVAEIMVYLTKCLIDRRPELFAGCLGIANAEEAVARREEILAFAENAALLHDVGKIFVIEAILTYGRNLIDSEFDLISTHPEVGASFLEMYKETEIYADAVRGHHRWFDDSAGYPHNFSVKDSEQKTIIALLSVADCLDASTDEIGRSYKKSRTLDEFIAEVKEGAGTRYASFMADLLSEPEVHAGLEKILGEKRDENYRKTFELLRSL